VPDAKCLTPLDRLVVASDTVGRLGRSARRRWIGCVVSDTERRLVSDTESWRRVVASDTIG
jgi:hypothetical protein